MFFLKKKQIGTVNENSHKDTVKGITYYVN